ncbi:thioesterase II family protein [Amycolatopsis saalfeldensis]|uniref:thioesterase II family protein n=1 Tax=Amycolatopsis saalfeldensis TaxID=394193 RepID=UPI0015A5578C|nr:alpha/beta fold hydrolase [Amycolatopsis saalfeldensis]
MRLFCLPHAGGGATVFRQWAQYLAPEIEVIAIRLPGRETRRGEIPFTSVDDLVPALMAAIRPWIDRPYAWFGHSLGALVAFEACRAARRLCQAEPTCLVVSGNPAPHVPPREGLAPGAPASEFVAKLKELSGTPVELLNNPSALSSILPTLRADYTMVETYTCREEPPLDCPITILGGIGDHSTSFEELDGWKRHTTAGAVVRMIPGGHFFVAESIGDVLPVVAADIRAASGGR